MTEQVPDVNARQCWECGGRTRLTNAETGTISCLRCAFKYDGRTRTIVELPVTGVPVELDSDSGVVAGVEFARTFRVMADSGRVEVSA